MAYFHEQPDLKAIARNLTAPYLAHLIPEECADYELRAKRDAETFQGNRRLTYRCPTTDAVRILTFQGLFTWLIALSTH